MASKWLIILTIYHLYCTAVVFFPYALKPPNQTGGWGLSLSQLPSGRPPSKLVWTRQVYTGVVLVLPSFCICVFICRQSVERVDLYRYERITIMTKKVSYYFMLGSWWMNIQLRVMAWFLRGFLVGVLALQWYHWARYQMPNAQKGPYHFD